jgi:hypothetical protein
MPAKVYLVLSLFGMILTLFTESSQFMFILNIVLTFLWALLLNWLCNKGYSSISWLLVLFPFFLAMILYLVTVFIALPNATYSTITPAAPRVMTAAPRVMTAAPGVLPTAPMVLPTAPMVLPTARY